MPRRIGEAMSLFIKDGIQIECTLEQFYTGNKIELLVNGRETRRMVKSEYDRMYITVRGYKIYKTDFIK